MCIIFTANSGFFPVADSADSITASEPSKTAVATSETSALVGVFELISPLETPTEVVINEYVDLTHAFFEKQTVGLVNGVLDKVALLRKKKNLG